MKRTLKVFITIVADIHGVPKFEDNRLKGEGGSHFWPEKPAVDLNKTGS